MALCGGLSQLLCSGTYGVCAALRDNFTASNMAGQGLAGVAPALAVVLVALSSSGTPDERMRRAPHRQGGCYMFRGLPLYCSAPPSRLLACWSVRQGTISERLNEAMLSLKRTRKRLKWI